MNIIILEILLSVLSGIIFGLYLKNVALFVYILLIFLLIFMKNKINKKLAKEFTIFLIISLVIFVLSSFQDKKFNLLYKNEEKYFGTGVISSFAEEKDYKNKYIIKVKELNGSSKYKNTKLILYLNKDINLEYGDKIYFTGIFEEAEKKRNDKGFDYQRYLRQSKIYGIFNIENCKIISKNKGIKYKIFKFKNDLKNRLFEEYNDEEAGFLAGILIGDKSSVSSDIKKDFKNSSLSHVLAISGMHVVYVVTAVNFVLDKFIYSKRTKNIILILFLAFFAFFTGGSASCIRACLMMIILIISKLLYRKNDFFTTWCVSLIIILLLNFYNIENIGMWLSFMCVLGLNKIKLSSSFAVQIAIFPIILYSYNVISLSFFVSNYLISFIIGPILILGYISLFLGKYLKIICLIEKNLLKILFKIAEIIGSLRISKIYVKSLGFAFFIIYYAIFFIIIYFDKTKIKFFLIKIKNIIKPHFKKIIIIFFIILFINLITPKNFKLSFLDVGQGDCCLIETKTGKKVLIDSGNNEDYDYGENVVLPYLLKHGISKIDYIMISHFDSDHCGGAFYIIENIKVKNIIIGYQYEETENLINFLKIAKSKNINIITVKNEDLIKIDKFTYFKIYSPIPNEMISENAINNNSIVCKLVCKNYNNIFDEVLNKNFAIRSILFTGDIEEIAEEKLIKKYENSLSSDILKVRTSWLKKLINRKFCNLSKT